MKELAACVLAIIALPALHCTPASAVGETAVPALSIAPSVRFSGMGYSSNAVWWGIDPDYWANAALLGYYHGVHFDHGRTQLIPSLASDVYFTTDRVAVGEWGIGVVMVDRPIRGLGKARLDYGTWFQTDAGGSVIDTCQSYENVRAYGVGINVLEIAENILRLTGRSSPQISRFAELSAGFCSNEAYVFLAPASEATGFKEAAGEVTTHDYGLLFRLTPYNSISHPGILPALDRVVDPFGGIHISVAYGSSVQNYDEKKIWFLDPEESAPIAKVSRRGWAVQGAVGLPRPLTQAFESHGLGVMAQSLTPLISVGTAWDRSRMVWPLKETPVETSGWEITLANIYSIRRGRIDDPDGKIHGDTRGWGLGLMIADFGGFRYDSASVPLAEDLGRRERAGYTLFLDPIRIYHRLKSHPAHTALR